MGAPVFFTFVPRTRPSVDDMATARTWLRPMCDCTSAVSRMATSPALSSMVSAV